MLTSRGGALKKARAGNPGGRPKVVAEVRDLARAHTGKAVQTLVSIMTTPKSAPAVRVSDANALLDRGYGKPPQHITGEGGRAATSRGLSVSQRLRHILHPRLSSVEHTGDTDEFRKAADMTDDELAAIISKAKLTVVK